MLESRISQVILQLLKSPALGALERHVGTVAFPLLEDVVFSLMTPTLRSKIRITPCLLVGSRPRAGMEARRSDDQWRDFLLQGQNHECAFQP
jgi:hypothetical protein